MDYRGNFIDKEISWLRGYYIYLGERGWIIDLKYGSENRKKWMYLKYL